MKKMKKSTIVLLALAAVLLISSAVGSTRAALIYYSEDYSAQVTVSNIGVSLLENDKVVSFRNYDSEGVWKKQQGELLTHISDEKFTLGEDYEEKLSVLNSGAIDSYVRVIVTRTWEKDGEIDRYLDPKLIQLGYVNSEKEFVDIRDMGEYNGWMVDEEASTPERVVLYFKEVVPAGHHTATFAETLSINPILQTKVIETKTTVDGNTTITYEYEYDGYKFNVEAEEDADQTHNAVESIKSAWGVDVTVDANGVISLQ